MQAYGEAFAHVYNLRWGGFARQVAPRIEALYSGTDLGKQERSLLDVCCGTGQLAACFLERGFRVTGIDLSEAMLAHARRNNASQVNSGQAFFRRADAAHFKVVGRFGLAVSTFDALNHLPDEQALAGCFRSVHAAVLPRGLFIFDLNTESGLRRNWNGLSVTDDEEAMIVTRGAYIEEERRGVTRLSGFVRMEDGGYSRFEETVYNVVFPLEKVRSLLHECGWSRAYFARPADLAAPITDPEAEPRVFVVAQR